MANNEGFNTTMCCQPASKLLAQEIYQLFRNVIRLHQCCIKLPLIPVVESNFFWVVKMQQATIHDEQHLMEPYITIFAGRNNAARVKVVALA